VAARNNSRIKSAAAERLAERARDLICEHLLVHGYYDGVDPVWLARVLLARLTCIQLLERLQRR
jgi:hypothetical protein